MTADPALVQLIRTFAHAHGFPPGLLLALGWGESGLNMWDTTGDGGLARGAFQVRIDVHGDDGGNWLGLDGTLNAMRRMESRWSFEYGRTPYAWALNPVEFLYSWWPRAQGSQQPTDQQCSEAVSIALGLEHTVNKVSPLRGRVGYWLRQFGDTAERTLPAILDTMINLGGGDCLCLKVADGLTWQGQIDSATPVRSVADIVSLKAQCEAAGVTFLPVVVPRGVAGEAERHAEIARAVGSLMTDIEPYAGFWDQAPYTQIPVYTRILREQAPDAYLINQPDPRPGAIASSHVVETAAHFDGIAAQHYVGWASVGWTDVNLEVQRVRGLAALGRDMYVTLYGVERIDLAGAFWQAVRAEVLGSNIFAFGAMNAEQLRHFATLPRPVAAEPVPGPIEPPPDTRIQTLLDTLTVQATALDEAAAAATIQAGNLRAVIEAHR